MFHGKVMAGADFSRPWVILRSYRRHRGWDKLPEAWGTPNLFVIAARSAANLRLFQIDHAYDESQYRISSVRQQPIWQLQSSASRKGLKEASW